MRAARGYGVARRRRWAGAAGCGALALVLTACGTQTLGEPPTGTAVGTVTIPTDAPVGQGRPVEPTTSSPSSLTTSDVPTTASATRSGTSSGEAVPTGGRTPTEGTSAPRGTTPSAGAGAATGQASGPATGSSAPSQTPRPTSTPRPTTPPRPTSPPASPSPSTPTVADPGAPTLSDFLPPQAVSQQPAGLRAQLVVSGVRVGPQPTYDRVVFDLTGAGAVGWEVRYTDQPIVDGSGAPVDLAGDGVLVVSMHGMALPGEGSTAYQPGMLLVPGTGLTAVTEVLRASVFEGTVTAYIGTRGAHRFSVNRLSDPARLVVDVAHD